MTRVSVVLALLAVVPGAGRLPAQEAAVPRAARLDAALPPAAADAVRGRVAEAQALGLPADALALRALELAAKGAEPADVVRRVNALAAGLADAARALRAGGRSVPAHSEIVWAADALASGLTPGDLTELARQTPAPLTIRLIVLTALLDRGLTSSEAIAAAVVRTPGSAQPPRPATAAGAGVETPPVVPAGATSRRNRPHTVPEVLPPGGVAPAS